MQREYGMFISKTLWEDLPDVIEQIGIADAEAAFPGYKVTKTSNQLKRDLYTGNEHVALLFTLEKL
jgi:hypothetical protein